MTLSTIGQAVTENRLQALDEAYHSRRRLLIAMFLVIGVVQTVLWMALSKPFDPLVSIDSVQLMAGGVICPGDTMLTRYEMTVRAPGVVDVDTTIARPNGITVYSFPTTRVIYDRPMTMTVETAWVLPRIYNSTMGDPRHWQVGEYVRLVAVTTTSRGGEPVIVATPFRIGTCIDD